jgi:hypothetical protein
MDLNLDEHPQSDEEADFVCTDGSAKLSLQDCARKADPALRRALPLWQYTQITQRASNPTECQVFRAIRKTILTANLMTGRAGATERGMDVLIALTRLLRARRERPRNGPAEQLASEARSMATKRLAKG